MDQQTRESHYRRQTLSKALTPRQSRRSRHKLAHQLRAAGRPQAAVAADLSHWHETHEAEGAYWTAADIQRGLDIQHGLAVPLSGGDFMPKRSLIRRRLGTQGGAHRQPRRQGRG